MGKKWKQQQTILLGSKITVDSDCSHEIKRCLLLGRKTMTNLDSVLKSKNMPLPTKVHIIKAMVFLIVMYGCESWTLKKAEPQRINAFELWCWRRLLRVLWTARRSNQSILKEINPEYSLEGLMLKLQYSGHLMQRADSLEKTLMLGMIEGMEKRGQHRIRWLDGTIDSTDMNLSKLWEIEKGREAWHVAVHGVAESQWTWVNDWTAITTSWWLQTLGKVEQANQILKRALVKLCLGPLFQMYATTPCTHLGHGIAFQIKGENSFMPWYQQHLAIFTTPPQWHL